jgi:hypothetical protein
MNPIQFAPRWPKWRMFLQLIPMVVLGALTSCRAVPPTSGERAPSSQATDSGPSVAESPPTPLKNFGPQLLQPVTGGAPITGIPLGGNLFQPLTGGPPVIGVPLFPDQ